MLTCQELNWDEGQKVQDQPQNPQSPKVWVTEGLQQHENNEDRTVPVLFFSFKRSLAHVLYCVPELTSERKWDSNQWKAPFPVCHILLWGHRCQRKGTQDTYGQRSQCLWSTGEHFISRTGLSHSSVFQKLVCPNNDPYWLGFIGCASPIGHNTAWENKLMCLWRKCVWRLWKSSTSRLPDTSNENGVQFLMFCVTAARPLIFFY